MSAGAAGLDEVLALEQRAFNAWPAERSVLFGGWLFRLAGGYTKRANSANAMQPGVAFDGVREAAEALYQRHGLPTVFRLSPLAPPAADLALADAGYVAFDPTQVATASLATAAPDASVRVDAEPSADWLDGFARANEVAAGRRGIHDAIVRSIAWPSGFATVGVDGAAAGFGLAVLERGAVGLFDIVVDPRWRRRGLGRTLTRALMDWGRTQGASQAYLQVREANEGARRLYAALGFEDRYRYHYRVPPGH
jgi:ribosomal protein S18 acetylase RimI-like enzyme